MKTGAAGKAIGHANYICGEGKYAGKGREEVISTLHGNMPSFASENPMDFWAASDEFGQASYTRKVTHTKTGEVTEKEFKGRAYREVEFSIPREITDRGIQIQYAKEFAKKIVGKNQPFTLGVHAATAKDGLPNINAHLMFSERQIDVVERSRELFFKRPAAAYRDRKTKEMVQPDPANGGAVKNRDMSKKDFVKNTRALYQAHALEYGIELDMRSNNAQGIGQPEPKIGPLHARANNNTYRTRRENITTALREERENGHKNRAAIFGRIGKSFEAAGRARAFIVGDFQRVGEEHRAIEAVNRGIEQAIHSTRHARETEGTTRSFGHYLGQLAPHIEQVAVKAVEQRPVGQPEPRIIGPNERAKLRAVELAKQQSTDALKTPQGVPAIVQAKIPQAAPVKSLAERFAASLAAFTRWVELKSGKLREIHENGEHHGWIKQADEHNAVQDTGRGFFAIHEQGKLSKPLIEGQYAEVKYRDGRGVVTVINKTLSKGIAD